MFFGASHPSQYHACIAMHVLQFHCSYSSLHTYVPSSSPSGFFLSHQCTPYCIPGADPGGSWGAADSPPNLKYDSEDYNIVGNGRRTYMRMRKCHMHFALFRASLVVCCHTWTMKRRKPASSTKGSVAKQPQIQYVNFSFSIHLTGVCIYKSRVNQRLRVHGLVNCFNFDTGDSSYRISCMGRVSSTASTSHAGTSSHSDPFNELNTW